VKVIALVPFNIIPPNFGGAERCLNLLSRIGDVTVIALNWDGGDQSGKYKDIHYRLISAEASAVERAKKLFGQTVQTYDGMPAFCYNDLIKLKQAIDEEAPDLIILEHPWLVPFVGDVPFIYDAHNAEAFLTSIRWPGTIDEQVTRELEKKAVENAKAITYCSELDADIFRKFYNATAPMHYIPNGTDLPDKLAEGKTKNLLFIGSSYGPNVRAAQELANVAPLLPDYKIQILGACGNYVRTSNPNVEITGQLTNDQMHDYFQNAYAFVNLMQTGSGTSLKIGRAMSYGLPVISTRVGARGYEGLTVIQNSTDLVQALENLEWGPSSIAARTYAEKISWDRVGMKFRGIVGGVRGG
jgi:glycosyltransferase involved in cell wall biosynthesis